MDGTGDDRRAEGLHRVLNGDARNADAVLASLASDFGRAPFLDATVTSPPYWSLVDYGTTGQIGFGQSEEQYLADCRQLFATLYRWTRDSGCLWLVVDSYLDQANRVSGVSPLRPLPFVLAGLAGEVGWVLREVVIWRKDKTRPWSHHGKLRNAFEYVLLLVKSNAYRFELSSLRTSDDLSRWWVRYPERYNFGGKAPDNVWDISIPVQGSWAKREYAHACPLPPELVRRLIALSTKKGDVVFDPFAGLGTVPAVAEAMGRTGLGIELNPTFVQHYNSRIRGEVAAGMAMTSAEAAVSGEPAPATISRLRVLKFPKALFVRYRQALGMQPPIALMAVLGDGGEEDGRRSVEYGFFVVDCEEEARLLVEKSLRELCDKPPLSKYGLLPSVRAHHLSAAPSLLGEGTWYAYEHGRTWIAARELAAEDAAEVPVSSVRGRYPAVLSRDYVQIVEEMVGDVAADDPTRARPARPREPPPEAQA